LRLPRHLILFAVKNVLVAREVVNLSLPEVPLWILNVLDKPVTIYKDINSFCPILNVKY